MSLRRAAALACLISACAVLALPSAAGAVATPPTNSLTTNGNVNAIASDGTSSWIGGDFTRVGQIQGSAVPVDTATANLVTPFPKLEGIAGGGYYSADVIPDGSGGWYAAGAFNTAAGTSRNRVVHILSDGTVDPAFNVNANGAVEVLLLSGASLYVGGSFTTVNGGTGRNRIARVSASTGTADAWNPSAQNTVRAMALQGTTLYIGGDFNGSTGGVARTRLAALDTTINTNNATTWNPQSNNVVRALAISASGTTIYAAGDFTTVNGGTGRNRIAELDLTVAAGTATAWNPSSTGVVRALELDAANSLLYAGGDFNGAASIGGQNRNRLAAISTATGNATSWNPNMNSSVYALKLAGTVMYAGGSFTTVNGGTARAWAAQLDTTVPAGTAAAWDPMLDATVRTIAVSGSTAYLGGDLTSANMAARTRLAKINSDGSLGSTNVAVNNTVSALACSGGILYLGGTFSGANSVGASTRNRAAAIDTSNDTVTAWNPNANNTVNSLLVSGGNVYLGGNYTTINGGTARNRLTRFSTAGVFDAAWNPNMNGLVSALATDGTDLYAAGSFNGANSVNGSLTRNRLAKISMGAAATGDAAWDPNANNTVTALAYSGGNLYIGGTFTTLAGGGTARNRIARLSPAGAGAADAWDPNASSTVSAISVDGTRVYAGGAFTTIGGGTRNRVAALDATANTTNALPWDPDSNNTVAAVLATSTSVMAGGTGFTVVGGIGTQNFFSVPAARPLVSLSPASKAFGSQRTGTSSAAQTVTLTNAGYDNLNVGALSKTGSDPTQFTISADSCSGQLISAGFTCTFQITFSPTSTGAKSASVSIPSDALASPSTVPMTGTGTQSAVSLSSSSFSFGTQAINTSSANQTLTITNPGTATLNIGAITKAGSDPTQFAVSSDTCSGQAVAAGGGTCTLDVRFSPTAAGAKAASLSIPSDAPTTPDTVTLSGTANAPVFGLAPSSKAYGSVLTGASSAWQTFTVTNSGAGNLVMGTVALAGADPGQFAIQSDTCSGQTLATSATCTVQAKFAPSATGAKSASLSFPSNAASSPDTASLTGTGITPAASLSPASKAYGSQAVGSQSAAQTFTLTSTGTATLNVGTVTLAGADPGDYLISGDGCSGQAIAPAGTCLVQVKFAPGSPGAKAATLSVPSDAASSPDASSLTGTGVSPAMTLAPASKAYGSVLTGSQSAAQTFTVTSTGTSSLILGSVSLAGADPGQFTVTADGCTGQTLAPAATCTIDVKFAPSSLGAKAASLTVPSNTASSPDTSSLTGTGIAPAASLAPASKAYGSVLTGSQSAAQTFTLTSSGTANLHVGSVALAGADPGQFTITADGCTGQTLAPAATCTVNVKFAPSSLGAKAATLSVPSDAPSSPDTSSLTGTGVSPALTLTPASKAYGSQLAGSQSAAQSFTVTSTGSSPVTVGSVALAGADPGDYLISGDGCSGQTLAPAATCVIQVKFTPGSTGAKSASLSVPSDAASSPDTASLTGTGIAPALTLTPASKAYGSVLTGSQSAAQSFTVTSSGTAPLHVGSAALTGADPGQFTVTADGCSGQTLAPAATCTVDVKFAPSATGAKAATLSVPSDAASSPDTSSLTGTGIAPAASLAPASHGYGAVNAGSQSSAQAFTLTSTGTAALHVGTVALAGANPSQFTVTSDGCTGQTLAPAATCAVNVKFAPSSTGAKAASLSVPSDDPAGPAAAALAGSGIAPQLSAAPASHDFGSVVSGLHSPAQSFTYTSTGTAPVTVGTVALAGANASQFDIVSDACSGQTLAPASACVVTARFSPVGFGSRSATLTAPSDDPASPLNVSLTGQGSGPQLTVAPAAVPFAAQAAGTASAPVTVTASSTGTTPVHVGAVSITGASPSQFQLLDDQCSGQTLAPGQSCAVQVRFSPSGRGAKAAAVSVASDDPLGPGSVTVTGTGTAPSFTITPGSATFGSQAAGTAAAPQSFTVTSTGPDPLHPGPAALSGTGAAQFAITADGCAGQALSAGQSCTVQAAFAPVQGGPAAASLQIPTDDDAGAAQASLSGTATTPAVSVPAIADFGTVDPGRSSQATVTISSSGTSPLSVTGLTVSGQAASSYRILSETCTAAPSAPGASCQAVLQFTPASGGLKLAALDIATSAGPAQVQLAGAGAQASGALTSFPAGANLPAFAGSSSKPQVFTFVNGGSAPLAIGSPRVTGPQAASFQIISGTCTGRTVPARGRCTVTVRFRSSTPGLSRATLTVHGPSGAVLGQSALQGTVRPGRGVVKAGPVSVTTSGAGRLSGQAITAGRAYCPASAHGGCYVAARAVIDFRRPLNPFLSSSPMRASAPAASRVLRVPAGSSRAFTLALPGRALEQLTAYRNVTVRLAFYGRSRAQAGAGRASVPFRGPRPAIFSWGLGA